MTPCQGIKDALTPSQSRTSHRQRFGVGNLMAEHGDRLPEAPSTLSTMINNGRPEPSITTIIERIRARSDLDGRDNRQNFLLRNFATQFGWRRVRRERWFHFRRRVPDALRTVFGRCVTNPLAALWLYSDGHGIRIAELFRLLFKLPIEETI